MPRIKHTKEPSDSINEEKKNKKIENGSTTEDESNQKTEGTETTSDSKEGNKRKSKNPKKHVVQKNVIKGPKPSIERKNVVVPSGGIKKPHRFRPGTVCLREIRKYQKGSDLLLKKAPFQRIVREIAQDFKEDCRFTREAIEALQIASEEYAVDILRGSYLNSMFKGRKTLMKKDVDHYFHVIANSDKISQR